MSRRRCPRAVQPLRSATVQAPSAMAEHSSRLGDVVARADLGVVGQCTHTDRGPAGSGGCDQRDRVTGQRGADQGAQHAVAGGIPDQDAAEQGVGVIGEHQFGVGGADRVGDHHFQRARGGGQRVTEAGHIDAEQFEFGGQISAGEFGVAVQQAVGDDFGGRVARCDQPVAAALDGGDFADRIHRGITGRALRSHTTPPRSPIAGRRCGPARHAGRTPAENTSSAASITSSLLKRDPQPAGLDRLDGRGARADGDPDAQFTHRAQQLLTAGLIDLQRHQPRREFDHVRPYPEQPQRVGRFQTEQPATDHDPDGVGVTSQRGLGIDADRVQIIQRPIHVAAGGVVAGHRRHERIRTSSQHQRVITLLGAIRDHHPLSVAVDTGDRATQAQLDQRITGIVVAGQRQRRPIPRTHIRRQPHPVISGIGLLTENHHPPSPIGITRPQSLNKTMPDHPVTDHRHGALTHSCVPFICTAAAGG